MTDKYILNPDHSVSPCDDLLEWGRRFGDIAARMVAKSTVSVGGKELRVSTVFIGLDHGFGDGPPLLFETMVFGDDDDRTRRYSTWDQAADGHIEVVTGLFNPHKDRDE